MDISLLGVLRSKKWCRNGKGNWRTEARVLKLRRSNHCGDEVDVEINYGWKLTIDDELSR